jgi:hypothetical protein
MCEVWDVRCEVCRVQHTIQSHAVGGPLTLKKLSVKRISSAFFCRCRVLLLLLLLLLLIYDLGRSAASAGSNWSGFAAAVQSSQEIQGTSRQSRNFKNNNTIIIVLIIPPITIPSCCCIQPTPLRLHPLLFCAA